MAPSTRSASGKKRKAHDDDESPFANCPVCLETVLDGERRVGNVDPCGHCFHLRCYNRYHSTEVHAGRDVRCPICKKPVKNVICVRARNDDDNKFPELLKNLLFASSPKECVKILKKIGDEFPAKFNAFVRQTLTDKQVAICQSAGLSVIVHIMHKYRRSSRVQKWACYILGSLFRWGAPNIDDLIAVGGLGALASATGGFELRTGLTAFNNILVSDKNVDAVIATDECKETIDATVLTMDQHHEKPRVQLAACNVLSKFANKSAALKKYIASKKGLSSIAHAIEDHENDQKLQKKARKLLKFLL